MDTRDDIPFLLAQADPAFAITKIGKRKKTKLEASRADAVRRLHKIYVMQVQRRAEAVAVWNSEIEKFGIFNDPTEVFSKYPIDERLENFFSVHGRRIFQSADPLSEIAYFMGSTTRRGAPIVNADRDLSLTIAVNLLHRAGMNVSQACVAVAEAALQKEVLEVDPKKGPTDPVSRMKEIYYANKRGGTALLAELGLLLQDSRPIDGASQQAASIFSHAQSIAAQIIETKKKSVGSIRA